MTSMSSDFAAHPPASYRETTVPEFAPLKVRAHKVTETPMSASSTSKTETDLVTRTRIVLMLLIPAVLLVAGMSQQRKRLTRASQTFCTSTWPTATCGLRCCCTTLYRFTQTTLTHRANVDLFCCVACGRDVAAAQAPDASITDVLHINMADGKLWAALLLYPTLVGICIPILYQARPSNACATTCAQQNAVDSHAAQMQLVRMDTSSA